MIEFTKKKFIIIGVVVAVLIVAVVAGTIMAQPKSINKKKPKAVEVTKTNPPVSGWVSSPDSSDGGPTTATISVDVNDTELVAVSVNILVKDDDGAHTETDGGSDPDTLSVTVGEDTFELVTEKSSGMANITKDYGTSDMHMFSENLTVTITGTDFGGGNHPHGPIGIVPIPFLVYIDQGAYYEVSITYTYLDYSGLVVEENPPADESGK